jgi:hypothetical protein
MMRSNAMLAAVFVSISTNTLAQSRPESHLLPALTPVLLVIDAEVSSDANKNGDRFPLHVAEAVEQGDIVLIPAGSVGEGEVIHAARSKGGGRAGELILAARFVTVGDNQVRLRSLSAGSGRDRTAASVGVSVGFGLLGMLVRGSELVMPAGTLVSAKTAEDVQLPAIAKALEETASQLNHSSLFQPGEEPAHE